MSFEKENHDNKGNVKGNDIYLLCTVESYNAKSKLCVDRSLRFDTDNCWNISEVLHWSWKFFGVPVCLRRNSGRRNYLIGLKPVQISMQNELHIFSCTVVQRKNETPLLISMVKYFNILHYIFIETKKPLCTFLLSVIR